jgi:hypothetical protein
MSGDVMRILKGRGISKFAGLATMVLFSGCVTEQVAPGANAVKLTRNAADVANCTAVGNVKAYAPNGVGDEVKFRNQVVGYGGNVGFVTINGACGIGACQTAAEGVAYRCL